MNIEEEFPARYWINLGRRQERRFETEWQLQKAGFTAERFPAVDARFVRKTRGYESAGRYALALSQRLAIRKAMLAGAKAVLILEDDVVFHPDIAKRLEGLELPEDWGIFYLGCAHRWRPWPSCKEGILRTPYALDTHAFAVRAPYYKQVMAALSVKPHRETNHALASDWFLADLHEKIPTYASYPNLAWQAVSSSDLAGGTYSNYTENGDQHSSAGELIGVKAEMWGGTRWKQMSGGISIHRQPKLGLLFLTRGDVNHPEIWQEFLENAENEVRGFAHVKEPERAGSLAHLQIKEWHDTKWGDISLVRAMLALLRAGLEDPELTHFAFVSESCIPVKPWREIRKRLQIDPRSIMALADAETMKPKHLSRMRMMKDLPVREMRVHPQWTLLNREAAECIMDYDFTHRFACVEAPDEHYFGTVLAMRGYPTAQRIKCQPLTWVRWHDDEEVIRPQIHSSVSPPLAAELADFPGFFARKFPQDSDVGSWGLHRDGYSNAGTYDAQ